MSKDNEENRFKAAGLEGEEGQKVLEAIKGLIEGLKKSPSKT